MSTIKSFIHTCRDVHSPNCEYEFLLPNVIDYKPNFIGMTSGKTYSKGLLVETKKDWNSRLLLKKLNTVKSVGFFGRRKKRKIIKQYIKQAEALRFNYPEESIVELDNKFNLITIESKADFLVRTKR